ncbi:MAG: discoidin domain-containing protein, partial [Clostridia bacterium]|nr:discoidin domain-containing protein [Clostridia bacterium]
VDKDNTVIDVDFTLAKACEFVCPEGGYIISYNGNKAGYDVMTKIKVGDIIKVYNVLLDKVAELEGNVALEQAGFTYGEPPVRPLSYQKAYTVTGNTRTDNFKDDGVKLTDGIMVENGGTAGSAGLPIADGPSITVDLGGEYAVDKFDLHAFGGNWGITIITGIKVAYSLDGENFTDIDVESVADATGNAWQETLFVVTLDAPVKARYVKFTAIGGNYIWADEVEVWESEKPVAPEPIEVEVKVKDNAILTDGQTGFSGGWGDVGTGKVLLVTNTACKEKPMKVIVIDELDEVKKVSGITLDLYHCANVMIGYPEGKAIVSVSADGETYTVVGEFDLAEAELSTGAAGTVSNAFAFDAVEAKFVKVELNVGSNAAVLGDSPADGKIYWEFISLAEVSVNAEDVGPVYEQGDLNGDGEVDAIDYLLLKKSILGSYNLSPEEEARADVNGDGEIDARDYIYLKKLVLAQ